MIIVSHRGNLNGPGTAENRPDLVLEASREFLTEVDLWYKDHCLFLGHDGPNYPVDDDFIKKENLIFHAKNLDAVDFLSKTTSHWFWHENDKMTMTSKGLIWSFPRVFLKKSIVVDFEEPRHIENVLGICTDVPRLWKNFLETK
jgi:hypothetical protein